MKKCLRLPTLGEVILYGHEEKNNKFKEKHKGLEIYTEIGSMKRNNTKRVLFYVLIRDDVVASEMYIVDKRDKITIFQENRLHALVMRTIFLKIRKTAGKRISHWITCFWCVLYLCVWVWSHRRKTNSQKWLQNVFSFVFHGWKIEKTKLFVVEIGFDF